MIDLTPLRNFIADHESEGAAKRLNISAYDVVWGKIALKDRPKILQSMTIGQVLTWQDSIDKRYPSEAAGRYQIMEDTLRGLYKEAGMGLGDKFDAAGQDRLCDALLKRRGLDKYLAGKISAETFCNNLAHEWASLPMVTGAKKGRSAYDGDGLNKAGVDVAPFLAVVRSLRAVKKAPPSTPSGFGMYDGKDS
jgi:hypothetical protein